MQQIRTFLINQQGVYSGIANVNGHQPFARNLFVNNTYEVRPGAEINDGDEIAFYFGTVDSQMQKANETFILDRSSPYVAEYGSWGIVTDVHFHLNNVYETPSTSRKKAQMNKRQSYLKYRKRPFFAGLHAIPSGGLTPGQVCAAYGFEQRAPVRPIKIGIVSLGGFYSHSDMQTAFTGYNLPAPTVTTAGPQNTGDRDSTVENMLDIECAGAAFAYATGQAAVIIEQFETNDWNGIPKAIDALVAAGCEVISISWGGPADEQNARSIAARAKACAAAAAANVHIFAASGDNSLDDGTNARTPDDPSCDPNVWGVGGTRLSLNPNGTIARESAWGDGNAADEGGGGGFDPDEPMPSYQQGVVPGSLRGVPDSSANADPASGYTIVANGQWMVVGGTSASTPLTAGYVAAILSWMPGPISQAQLQASLYRQYKSAFNDITTGSDGTPATPGWDEATGCGSINGPGMAAALLG